MSERNWAGNFQYGSMAILRHNSVDEAREIVASRVKVKPLGTKHSFNPIADTSGDQISTSAFDKVISLDREKSTVTIQGGIRYGTLAEYLESEGFALPNLASLPHISVVGACATATHGSGVGNASLSTAILSMDVILADGSLTTISRETLGDRFDGMVVGLGAFGLVVSATLQVIPSFQVAQTVYENLPGDSLRAHFDEIVSGAYSVSLFTNWTSDSIGQVWVKRLAGSENPDEYFGAVAASGPRHMLPEMPVKNCTEQMGVPGPWHHRLPHFKMEFTPSGGEELQSEYFVKRENALDAIKAVSELGAEISPLLYVTEIRTIARDSFWMSPCYERDCVAIHFTWRQMIPEVTALLPKIEEMLAPFGARPHWGKIFAMKADRIGKLYPRIEDFRMLAAEYDPTGKFRNEFLDERVFN